MRKTIPVTITLVASLSAFGWALSQTLKDKPSRAPQATAFDLAAKALSSRAGVAGFGGGTASGRLVHYACPASAPVCTVTVHARIIEKALLNPKERDCYIRVPDVVFLNDDVKKLSFVVSGPSDRVFEFWSPSTGLDIANNHDLEDPDTEPQFGKRVFELDMTSNATTITFNRVIKVYRVFPYTVRLKHKKLDGTGGWPCAPLDPVIVNMG